MNRYPEGFLLDSRPSMFVNVSPRAAVSSLEVSSVMHVGAFAGACARPTLHTPCGVRRDGD